MRNVSRENILSYLIDFAFSIAIIGLIIRLLLRLFSANPENAFVEFIYISTSPLLDPFRGIFTPLVIEPGYVFEFSTLIAIAIYALVAYLITSLINYIYLKAKSAK